MLEEGVPRPAASGAPAANRPDPVDLGGTRVGRLLGSRVFQAVVTIGVLGLLARVATAGKDLVVAYRFGTSDAVDALLIAALLPVFALNVIVGPLQAAFIPVYVRVREQVGADAAGRLASSTLVCVLAVAAGAVVLLAAIAPLALPLLGSGFDPEKMALTRTLFFSLLPLLVVGGMAGAWGCLLNATDRFAVVAVAPVLTPVAAVAALLAWGSWAGIGALVAGTLAGTVLEASVVLVAGLRRRLPVVPRWYGPSRELRDVGRQFLAVAASVVFMSSTGLVDQAMAAMLEPGSVSALSYGGKLVSFVVAVGTTALGTAVLPHFSRLVATHDWTGLVRTARSAALLTLAVTVPVTLALVALALPLVDLLFGRGAFSPEDVRLVARVHALYALQIPFYALGIVGVRLLSAAGRNHVLAWIAAVNTVANVIGNYFLMRALGVAGIGLSTSLVYVLSATLIFLALVRLFGKAR